MSTSEEKAGKFMEAITRYAEEQRLRIHQEVEDFRRQRMLEAEQTVMRDAYRLIQTERQEALQHLRREVAARETDARRALFSRRAEMVDAVCGDAREQLLAFTQTPRYGDLLRDSLAAMTARLPADSVYELSRRDEVYADALRAALPDGAALRLTDDIALGGLRGGHAASGVLLDDTLDTRFAAARDAFIDRHELLIQ